MSDQLRKLYLDIENKKMVVRGSFDGSANSAELVNSDSSQYMTPIDLDNDLSGSPASLEPADMALTTGSMILGAAGVGVEIVAKTDKAILIGNGTTVTSNVMSGDIVMGNTGITSFNGSPIVDADINASAAIAYSKMAALATGSILLGVGNVATVTDIKTDANILIGDGTTAALHPLSGDVTMINTGAVTIGNNKITPAKMQAGMLYGIVIEDADTSSREENVAGLSSAITLCNALQATMNAHSINADNGTPGAGEHTISDVVNFPVAGTASDLATLLSQSGLLLTAYAAHDVDAVLALPAIHDAQTAANALVSAVTPTTLQEAITRLNDLRTKYNLHTTDATSHDNGGENLETAAVAAYGIANFFPVANVLPGDLVNWSILNDGTGNVTGVSAVAGTAGITFTFSADPQNDTIISYGVFRATP